MKQHRNATMRTLLSLITALVMMLGTTSAIFAQATPEATPGASGSAGPALGDAIVIPDSNGDPQLQIAATTLTDPDKTISGGDRGFHYVALEVVVQNTTATEAEFNAFSISLIDAEGFVYTPTYANRSSDDYTARPDFSDTTIPANGSASGWLFYQVINGATPAWVVYSDAYSTQQFAVLANLEGAEIGSGDPITFYDADAAEAGTVTVNEVITDFQKVDTSLTVDRGSTIVAIDVTVENTSDVDMANSPTFYVVDDFGFQYYQTYSFRSDADTSDYPDFPSDPIAAGASASGVILFQIAKGAEISYVTFQPDYQQLYIVAQPGPGSVVSGDTLTPVAVATNDGGVTDEPTEDTGSTGTETGDCVGVKDWVGQVQDAISGINNNDAFNADSLADVDPADLHDAADLLRESADTVDGLDAPDVAGDASDAMVSFLNGYADVVDGAADRLDKGDDPKDVEADLASGTEFNDLFTSLTGAITSLSTACPDSGVDAIFDV